MQDRQDDADYGEVYCLALFGAEMHTKSTRSTMTMAERVGATSGEVFWRERQAVGSPIGSAADRK
jgi:hypothetical protein